MPSKNKMANCRKSEIQATCSHLNMDGWRATKNSQQVLGKQGLGRLYGFLLAMKQSIEEGLIIHLRFFLQVNKLCWL